MSDSSPASEGQLLAGVYTGNAVVDDVAGSGWFVGQFVPKSCGLRHQDGVELKWGVHRCGDRRPAAAAVNLSVTTVSILVRGTLRTELVTDAGPVTAVLANEGDYLVVGPGVTHSWEALEDSLVLSVRFPSVEVSERHAPSVDARVFDTARSMEHDAHPIARYKHPSDLK